MNALMSPTSPQALRKETSGVYAAGWPPAFLGRAAHAAIPGSTWTAMAGVGHFPMSENPEAFIGHQLPILDSIRRPAAAPAS
jgi:pimeloyl-ACP methyl ester carboxylesterase